MVVKIITPPIYLESLYNFSSEVHCSYKGAALELLLIGAAVHAILVFLSDSSTCTEVRWYLPKSVLH